MTNTLAPRYTHDCDACTYLGRHEQYDLYHCMQGGMLPTVIARFSSEGPDYISGMVFATMPGMEHMAEAKRRAAAAGLAVDDPWAADEEAGDDAR